MKTQTFPPENDSGSLFETIVLRMHVILIDKKRVGVEDGPELKTEELPLPMRIVPSGHISWCKILFPGHFPVLLWL